MVLNKLRLLGGAEEETLAVRGRSPDGAPLTFAQLLEDARRTWGEKIAYQQKARREWQRINYIDLYKRSYDIASGLAASGIVQGDRVAIIAENSIEWVTAYYGIVLAGAIAVPMYYELKPEEIAEMSRGAAVRAAFVGARSLSKFDRSLAPASLVVVIGERAPLSPDNVPHEFASDGKPQVISLEELARRADYDSRQRVASLVASPDDVASIVFTSGTTGGMKGVMLTHRNFMTNLASIRTSIPFNDRDRLVMVLPMHHAFPFIVTVVVAPAVGGEITFENDLRRIRDRMAEVKPTLLIAVPQLLEVMYRNVVKGIEAQGRRESFEKGLRIVEATKQRTGINLGRIVFRELHKRLGGSLRFIVSGGAALNPETARDFARLGIPVLQGWGMTEAAPVLSVQRWQPRKFYMSNYYEEHIGSVGQPLDGVEIALIDVPEKELYVHLHGEGELVTRGGNITPGYWQAEEATKAAKLGDWLRTGDVGRIDDEGNIWITGRSKFVIVLDSGEKVHPDEVEEKLSRSPLIEDVVVVGRSMRGRTQPVAVVFPNRDEVMARLGEARADEESVRALVRRDVDQIQRDIAQYKRVVDIVLTDEPLPKTAGLRKVQRALIRDQYRFDPRRWEQTWRAHLEATALPADEPEAAAATA
jgi:long-chain acyl-CoA synthetase